MSWAIYDVDRDYVRMSWIVKAKAGDLRCYCEFSVREIHDRLPRKPDRIASALHSMAGGSGTLEEDWVQGALARLELDVVRAFAAHLPGLTHSELGGLDLLRKMLV